MSGESHRSQTERDDEASEDAWYRALKAKAEDRLPDPGDGRPAAVASAPTDPTAEGDD